MFTAKQMTRLMVLTAFAMTLAASAAARTSLILVVGRSFKYGGISIPVNLAYSTAPLATSDFCDKRPGLLLPAINGNWISLTRCLGYSVKQMP